MAEPEKRRARDRRGDAGRAGERAAAAFLERRGWRIVQRNARTRYGELDLIASTSDTLVFVEVKARRGAGSDSAVTALESIGPRKRLQIRRLARAWLAENRPPCAYREIRFDAIGVSVGPDGAPNGLEHVPAAF